MTLPRTEIERIMALAEKALIMIGGVRWTQEVWNDYRDATEPATVKQLCAAALRGLAEKAI